MVEKDDSKQYDLYKNIKDSKRILNEIIKEKPMFPNIFYWDNSISDIMIEFDLEENNTTNLNNKIEKLKTVHNIFKKGYLNKDDITDKETFNILQEYITAVAFRYSLIHRKPFILLNIKYNKLEAFEIKCIYEYVVHDPLYLQASKHKDPICYVKIGWWLLKDIIEKHKDMIKVGMSEYEYEGDHRW
ncbi:MAG: hypothetical protein PHP08_00080 [Candidatus Dojkabacteria bacterium]|nr:hypothetical protein [Candidatus Dojkabacteria bacterium]